MDYYEQMMKDVEYVANQTEYVVIASKRYEYNGTTVTSEMAYTRDKATGEVINGSCYAYYNGIFHGAKNYQDAIRIAQEIVEAWKAGKDYEGGN